MNDSILTSIKKMLGIVEADEAFDSEIIMHINTAFMVLEQLGIGPAGGFSISDKTATWSEYWPDARRFEAVKSYVYLRVKLLFDSTNLNSYVIQSINQQIEEYQWRLNCAAENE